MERAKKLKYSQEFFFLNSPYSADTTSNSITVISTPSKAGALPLAILIHDEESERSYTNAFTLLKDNFLFVLGGKSVSHFVCCFIYRY